MVMVNEVEQTNGNEVQQANMNGGEERLTDIHPRSPLYLHPSDTPGIVLVPQLLTGIDNYSAWSNSMKVALLAKNKIGFINGKCKKEQYKNDLEYEWERCNAFVLSWITNSVSKELATGLVYASDARSVWEDLKERFDKKDLTRIYQLQKEVCTLTQGTMTVSEYFSKLRNAWDEYWNLVPLPQNKEFMEHMEQQKLVQFLMGLNETYAQSRSQILMTIPAPTLNQAYNMLMRDESQKAQSNMIVQAQAVQHLENDPTALAASHNNRSKQGNGKFCDHCRIKGHWRSECWKLNENFCDFCNIKGHKREDCRKEKGKMNNRRGGYNQGNNDNRRNYENDVNRRGGYNQGNNDNRRSYESNDNRRSYANSANGSNYTNAPDINDASTSSSAGSTVPRLTPEQYQQLMRMLNKEPEISANMAGPLQWKGVGDW